MNYGIHPDVKRGPGDMNIENLSNEKTVVV